MKLSDPQRRALQALREHEAKGYAPPQHSGWISPHWRVGRWNTIEALERRGLVETKMNFPSASLSFRVRLTEAGREERQ